MQYEEFLKSSEEFLFSPDFKELETRLAFPEPNIWEILGISRKETLVTQFLAWLLNPQEQHSFDDRFLKAFTIEALKTSKGRQSLLSPVEVAIMNLSTASVQAEYWLENRRCDILISSEQHQFLCVIENKIGAKESKEQTKDYYRHSLSTFPQEQYSKRVYIFLSPDGIPPESDQFIPLSYQAVLTVIHALETSMQGTETERFLLRQFQDSLRRSVAMDQETLDLVQSVYDTYGHIIDFIYNNAEKPDRESGESVWDGKSWFFNIGEKDEDSYIWEDCRTYSFICAGGGKRYQQIMLNFKVGDIVYAYVSKHGYVGIGEILSRAVPFRKAQLEDGTSLKEMTLLGTYDTSDDDEHCDWIAFIEWKQSVPKEQAVRLAPIVRSTAARMYNHNKSVMKQIQQKMKH